MDTLEPVHYPCKVIVMDDGLDTSQIITIVNKYQYTKFVFLYLTENNLQLKSKFFPGTLYTTNAVFYFSIDPSEAMKHVAFNNCSTEDQISCES